MPNLTAIAIDQLIEPGPSRRNAQNGPLKPPPVPVKTEQPKPVIAARSALHRPNVSPALYATPESTSLPDSPTSFTPSSPYIINHKRRGPRLLKSLSQTDVGVDSKPVATLERSRTDLSGVDKLPFAPLEQSVTNANHVGKTDEIEHKDEDVVQNDRGLVDDLVVGQLDDDGLNNGLAGNEDLVKSVKSNVGTDGENDDFFDPNDTLSVASSTDFDDINSAERSFKSSTPSREFYDALEDVPSDGEASAVRNIEDELREVRLALFAEKKKRKQAEEELCRLQSRWNCLSDNLSVVGLKLHAMPTPSDAADVSSVDPIVDLCQQITVSQTVGVAVARACARADVTLEMEPLIAGKNFEIARLTDRIQYYEATIREMTQRNQEAVEKTRQERNRRRRRQKWIWASVGLAFTLGASVIAWSYMPAAKPETSHANNATEAETAAGSDS